jgi:hypothetical protein
MTGSDGIGETNVNDGDSRALHAAKARRFEQVFAGGAVPDRLVIDAYIVSISFPAVDAQAMRCSNNRIRQQRKENGPHDRDGASIGRRNNRNKLPESIRHNPFVIGKDGIREEVIAKSEAYLMSRPDLLAQLHTLKGKRLACWCARTSEKFDKT